MIFWTLNPGYLADSSASSCSTVQMHAFMCVLENTTFWNLFNRLRLFCDFNHHTVTSKNHPSSSHRRHAILNSLSLSVLLHLSLTVLDASTLPTCLLHLCAPLIDGVMSLFETIYLAFSLIWLNTETPIIFFQIILVAEYSGLTL